MATSSNVQLAKLAISIVSVAAVAGITGQLAAQQSEVPQAEESLAAEAETAGLVKPRGDERRAAVPQQGRRRPAWEEERHDHDDHDDDDHDDDDDWGKAVDAFAGQLLFDRPGAGGAERRTRTRHS